MRHNCIKQANFMKMEEPNYSGFKCFECGEDYPNCECNENDPKKEV